MTFVATPTIAPLFMVLGCGDVVDRLPCGFALLH